LVLRAFAPHYMYSTIQWTTKCCRSAKPHKFMMSNAAKFVSVPKMWLHIIALDPKLIG